MLRPLLAILGIDLADRELVRTYGKRWNIEVFFKMMKHHLNLEREAQLLDFDGIIDHPTIVMSRYVFMMPLISAVTTIPARWARSFFRLLRGTRDLTLMEAMQRLHSLTSDKVRASRIHRRKRSAFPY